MPPSDDLIYNPPLPYSIPLSEELGDVQILADGALGPGASGGPDPFRVVITDDEKLNILEIVLNATHQNIFVQNTFAVRKLLFNKDKIIYTRIYK